MNLKIFGIAVVCAVLIMAMTTVNVASAWSVADVGWNCDWQNSQGYPLPCYGTANAGLAVWYDDNYNIYNVLASSDFSMNGLLGGDCQIIQSDYPINQGDPIYYGPNTQLFIVANYYPYDQAVQDYQAYIWLWHYPSYTPQPSHAQGDWYYIYY